MPTFNHDNLPKTRRSILIVCFLIITTEKYLSASIESIGFGGLVLEITKPEFVTGLCIGLLYLWIVMGIHLTRKTFLDSAIRIKDKEHLEITEFFMPSGKRKIHLTSRKEEKYYKDSEIEAKMRIDKKTKERCSDIELKSELILLIPPFGLTGLIMINYLGPISIF